MWYEYPIPANPQKQREIIRQMKKWIERLETRGLIEGFAFNHYYSSETAKGTLNLRFDCIDEGKLKIVKKELELEVKKLVPNYVVKERLWDAGKSPEYIYKSYEFGSRCAFLFWDLVERNRFSEELTSSFLEWVNSTQFTINQKLLNFQLCFNHGLMNSLGISKIPNEQIIHLAALKESTRSYTPQELVERIRNQFLPFLFPTRNK